MGRGDGEPPQDEGRLRFGWLFGVVWLVYLTNPLSAVLAHRPGPARDLGIAAVLAFAAAYVALLHAGRNRRFERRRTVPRIAVAEIAGLLALVAAMAPAAQEHALAALVFVGAAVMFLLPVRAAWAVVVAVTVGAEAAAHAVPGWTDRGDGLGVLLAAVAVNAIRIAFDRNRRLLETREEMAQLAVSAERSRFARDLHDILGHSLTVIAVKAELAGRLVREDPDRAVTEVGDLERLSRQALADVRAAVAGYREVTLSRELASAREALSAVGVEADLPTAVDEVPGDLRELFGWVVREGVTNVVRHSRARRCTVRLRADAVEVVDDGTGLGGAPAGHGLSGLRERAAAAGASLSVGPAGPAGGCRLRLTVDEATAPAAAVAEPVAGMRPAGA